MRAKKSYGQHFLINESLCQRIVDVFDEYNNIQNVVEVGSGKGAITKYIIQKNYNFKAIEADQDMIEHLWLMYPMLQNKFLNEDFLISDLNTLYNGEEFSIIGNFPYNISSQIVFKIIEHKELIPLSYGMFQKEVADRIVAPSGSKTYGILSVIFQSFYDCTITQKISPGSFSPPPKVNSAMVMMKRKDDYTIPCDYKFFKTVVRTSFNQRRKMMRNSLKSLVGNPDLLKDEIFTKRPEQITKEEFYDLTNKINNNR
ncbi:MAG: 16S rRNA (adenine(1518)-N(6)/adenine(1519)-N(6))-dimethyltransferase RsmA [Saprospiraceae bacterium]